MTLPCPISDEDREQLIAFLDGELTEAEAREVELRLSREPLLRVELQSLKNTWDMLDYLPRTEPSPSFTERTLSRLDSVRQPVYRGYSRSFKWRKLAFVVGWAAALLVAGWLGYQSYSWVASREPNEEDLIRDLRLIENKRFYELIDSVQFLDQLDHPDLFGDESGG